MNIVQSKRLKYRHCKPQITSSNLLWYVTSSFLHLGFVYINTFLCTTSWRSGYHIKPLTQIQNLITAKAIACMYMVILQFNFLKMIKWQLLYSWDIYYVCKILKHKWRKFALFRHMNMNRLIFTQRIWKMNYLSLQNLPFETERLEHPFTKMFDKERPK